MAKSNTMLIRDTIKAAKLQKDQLAQLHTLITENIPRLHGSINLPEKNPESALVNFVGRYIDHVPNFLDAVRGLTKEAGIDDYASIFLDTAEEFFIKPPEVIASHSGMMALMDQSYLAHRLIEEVNDRVVGRCGIPLTPMDMTTANLIVHQLIGEPFANDLDFIIHYSLESHMDSESSLNNPAFKKYIADHKERGWKLEIARWPCLAEDLSIRLNFSAGADSKDIH
ncbi:hypothetical protein NBRC116493_27410 [Aurantivibrio infirmus]